MTATPRTKSLIGEQSALTYRSTEAFRLLQYHGTLVLVGEPPRFARDRQGHADKERPKTDDGEELEHRASTLRQLSGGAI